MNKLAKISLLVISCLVLSGCSLQTQTNQSNSNKNQPESNKSMSLKDLISLGVAQKCTWTVNDDNNQVTGEILIKDKKFKQTTKINNPNGQTEFNAISDGQWMYTWSNDSTTGNMAFKMKIEDPENQSDNQNPSSVDWEKQYNYSCSPTTVSDQDFSLPSGIEFMDINEFSQNMGNAFSTSITPPSQE
ncbi:MAG: hypothetical protein PHX34_03645 [Candidatus Shapirobacteria bacterium]|nr:hypothetical protein [Candidatus Shapirobacteria bacterium]